MSTLPHHVTDRLGKLIPRLATESDGERLGTVAAIRRVLQSEGHDLHDLAAHVSAEPKTLIVYRDREPSPSGGPRDYGSWRKAWERSRPNPERDRVLRCQRLGAASLTAWENAFLESLLLRLSRMLCLTAKQLVVVAEIEAKLGARA